MSYLSMSHEADAICLHCLLPGHNKFYVVWLEIVAAGGGKIYLVLAAWGKITNPKAQAQNEKGRWTNIQAARRQAQELADQKMRNGYENVESGSYRGGYSFTQVLEKATIHCLSSSTAATPAAVAAALPKARHAAPQALTTATQHRSRRLLET